MRDRGALGKVLPPLIALALLLGVWELATRLLEVRAFILPPPSAIATVALAKRASLLSGVLTTGREALSGFALSAVIGVLSAIGLASSRLVERAFYPYTVFLQTVPIVAIAPLLVVWFGPGFRSVAVAAFIVSVFPVIANTLTGLHSVDPALRDMFRLYGAGRAATLFKLTLPSAVPHIVTGLRIASGLAVIGAIVGELVAGFAEDSPGLGILVMASFKQFETDFLFAAILSSTALGIVMFSAVNLAGARILGRFSPSDKEGPKGRETP